MVRPPGKFRLQAGIAGAQFDPHFVLVVQLDARLRVRPFEPLAEESNDVGVWRITVGLEVEDGTIGLELIERLPIASQTTCAG